MTVDIFAWNCQNMESTSFDVYKPVPNKLHKPLSINIVDNRFYHCTKLFIGI